MPATVDRVLIAALFVALERGGLATTPVLDRDEGRFAEASRDMRERGGAVVPFFDGEPRHHKPILIGWLQASAMAVLGPTELAVRLPSVLAGAALALAVAELARAMFSRRAAALAALIVER